MKRHRELGMTQKSAWFVLHRLRKAAETGTAVCSGPLEVDETSGGGTEKNTHNRTKRQAGHGLVGTVAGVGVKDRERNTVKATVVDRTDAPTDRAA